MILLFYANLVKTMSHLHYKMLKALHIVLLM